MNLPIGQDRFLSDPNVPTTATPYDPITPGLRHEKLYPRMSQRGKYGTAPPTSAGSRYAVPLEGIRGTPVQFGSKEAVKRLGQAVKSAVRVARDRRRPAVVLTASTDPIQIAQTPRYHGGTVPRGAIGASGRALRIGKMAGSSVPADTATGLYQEGVKMKQRYTRRAVFGLGGGGSPVPYDPPEPSLAIQFTQFARGYRGTQANAETAFAQWQVEHGYTPRRPTVQQSPVGRRASQEASTATTATAEPITGTMGLMVFGVLAVVVLAMVR